METRMGAMLYSVFLEKGVDNELITFVGYKQLWRAVQPTANCEEIQKGLTFLSWQMMIQRRLDFV